LQQKIIKAFGTGIINEKGQIDRAKLGSIIFSDPTKRKVLNKITHPLILKGIIFRLLRWIYIEKRELIVIDSPLLFETKLFTYLNYPIAVVHCGSESLQVERLRARNPQSEEEALNKIRAQMPITEKIKRADVTIENSGSLKDLEREVKFKAIPAILKKLGIMHE